MAGSALAYFIKPAFFWLVTVASYMATRKTGREMGAQPSVPGGGNRTIASRRVFVAIRYPAAVEEIEGTLFNEYKFRSALLELQQVSCL